MTTRTTSAIPKTFSPPSRERPGLIRSGIQPIDEQLGGLMPGRTYVLSGAPGTGKSVACLQFLVAAAAAGERAAILSQDDPQDLLSQSDFISFDLANAVASERIYLCRFQLDFSRRFSRASSPDLAFKELRSLFGDVPPTRLVIDSVVPFIDGGVSSAAGAIAMLELIEELGATALVTYPGDLAGVYDRRLDPLVQRAAAIFHLSADRQRHRQIEIRKVRYRVPSVAPLPYRIEPGLGIVSSADEVRWQEPDESVGDDRQRIVLELPAGAALDALRLLQSQYAVNVVEGGANGPKIVATPPSSAPARRATDFPGAEKPLLPNVKQPTRNGMRVPFDASGFRGALLDVESRDPRALFTVVVVTAPPGQLEPFTNVALKTVRAVNGDLVGVANNQVYIYLHGTGRKHAPYFVERLRDNWLQAGRGELIVEIISYPADQDRLRTLIAAAS